MSRNFELTRDEAEFLTDLLMLTDHPRGQSIDDQLRVRFGMCPQSTELDRKKTSLSLVRANWVNALLKAQTSDSQRKALLDLITDDICTFCGGVLKDNETCHCTNDE